MNINPTTRTFPRTLEEAFPNNAEAVRTRLGMEWFEAHEQAAESRGADADFWVSVVLAFAAGFVACYISLTA